MYVPSSHGLALTLLLWSSPDRRGARRSSEARPPPQRPARGPFMPGAKPIHASGAA